jgi:hypothetical protein
MLTTGYTLSWVIAIEPTKCTLVFENEGEPTHIAELSSFTPTGT